MNNKQIKKISKKEKEKINDWLNELNNHIKNQTPLYSSTINDMYLGFHKMLKQYWKNYDSNYNRLIYNLLSNYGEMFYKFMRTLNIYSDTCDDEMTFLLFEKKLKYILLSNYVLEANVLKYTVFLPRYIDYVNDLINFLDLEMTNKLKKGGGK